MYTTDEQICSLLSVRCSLLLESKLSHERAVPALVVDLQVLQMLAAISDQAEQPAARVQILAILVQMSRKFLYAAGQDRYLYLRGTRIGVMSSSFGYFISLFTLRKHWRNSIMLASS